MKIFPAIDLFDAKVVRLIKGDYKRMTVYGDDPLQIAKDFEKQGAAFLHLVDLEGARDGGTPNLDCVRSIVRGTGLFCEIGGGIRSAKTIERYLELGVDRVILGTAAVTDEELLARAVKEYGERIAVGIDLADGFVAIRGWREKTLLTCDRFFEKMAELGVRNVICTDISKDGMLGGVNRGFYRSLNEKYRLDITASGGVSTIDDVRALSEIGLYGAIIGKAYYDRKIDLRQAIEVAK